MVKIGENSFVRTSHLHIYRVGGLIEYDIYDESHPVHEDASEGHEFVVSILLPENLTQVVVGQFFHELFDVIAVLHAFLFLHVLFVAGDLFVLLNTQ